VSAHDAETCGKLQKAKSLLSQISDAECGTKITNSAERRSKIKVTVKEVNEENDDEDEGAFYNPNLNIFYKIKALLYAVENKDEEISDGACKKYILIKDAVNWDTAFALCRKKNMQLVSIESAAEQKCIESINYGN